MRHSRAPGNRQRGRARRLATYDEGVTVANEEGPAGRPARLLRGRRPGRRHGREGPRALRLAGLRAQGDRAQQARRDHAAEAWRDLRRRDRRGARGRHRRVLARTGWPRSSTRRRARCRCKTIDATCPLVTKVHREAVRFADDDYDILLIGHEGHEEVVGTAGEAPEHITLVDGPDDVDNVEVRDPDEGRLAVADHAVGRRDDGDRAAAARAVPLAAGPAQRRHLLRHPEPPARGQADGRRQRPDARRRLAQLVQLGAAGRGRPRARFPRRPPGRLRRRDRRGLARGGARPWASPPAPACPRSWCATC